MQASDEASAKHPPWSDFWSQTRQGAIDLAATDPVATALREHWLAQMAWLAGCTNVADVGSGPAVLPRMLLKHAPDALAGLRWVCLDQAHVPHGPDIPPEVDLRTGEDFVSSSPGELLVDALISNFGVEYVTDQTLLASACARWLPTAGRLHVVVHSKASVIDQASGESADDIIWALEDVRLFDIAGQLFTSIASVPHDPIARMMHGVEVRDVYNAAVNRLKTRMQDRGSRSPVLIDMLNAIRSLADLAARGQPAQAHNVLDQMAAAFRGEVSLHRAMQSSALDESRLDELESALGISGFGDILREPLGCELGPIAWVVSARRL